MSNLPPARQRRSGQARDRPRPALSGRPVTGSQGARGRSLRPPLQPGAANLRTVCETMLGPDYKFVEVGFDTPFPGAKVQPWHRDFPSLPETKDDRRLTSLAFNLTTVDTTDEMGPFEVAPGTQWDRGDDFHHEQFPAQSEYARF